MTAVAAVLGIVAALTLPLLVLVGLLAVADRLQRRRLRVVARQVAVTDAIHREFGAVVAPVVSKQWGGPWTVLMALPPERWAMAGALVAIAHRALATGSRRDARVRVVLTLPTELARSA
ncbi:MAG: hypothetical protein ACREK6_12050 [Candidatus Rokuibacteriota bacterium]